MAQKNFKRSTREDKELDSFRAEAERLMLASFGDLPVDVFAMPPETRTE
jgi:hypothetical protein